MAFESGENFVGFVVATFSYEETGRIWEEWAETPDENRENCFRSILVGMVDEATYKSGRPMGISKKHHLVQRRSQA